MENIAQFRLRHLKQSHSLTQIRENIPARSTLWKVEPCQAHRHLHPPVVTYSHSAYLPPTGPTVCLHSHTWPHLPAEAKSIIAGPVPSL